MTIKDKNSNNI